MAIKRNSNGQFGGDNKVSATCRQCGKVFVTYAAWVRKGGGKYCSPGCHHLSMEVNNPRARKDGYVMVKNPEHHRANKWGFVYQHIIAAENKIGRLLKDDEVVHHINGNPSDNHPDNIFIFSNRGDHARHHLTQRNFNRG
jgi:hypothetical protein